MCRGSIQGVLGYSHCVWAERRVQVIPWGGVKNKDAGRLINIPPRPVSCLEKTQMCSPEGKGAHQVGLCVLLGVNFYFLFFNLGTAKSYLPWRHFLQLHSSFIGRSSSPPLPCCTLRPLMGESSCTQAGTTSGTT